jgi:hypothetical protein
MEKYVINNLYIFEKRINNKSKLVIGKFKKGNAIVTMFKNMGVCLYCLEPYLYTRDELGRLISISNFFIRNTDVNYQLLDEKYINLYDYMKNNEDVFYVNTSMRYFLNYKADSNISKNDVKDIENYINRVCVLKK